MGSFLYRLINLYESGVVMGEFDSFTAESKKEGADKGICLLYLSYLFLSTYWHSIVICLYLGTLLLFMNFYCFMCSSKSLGLLKGWY